MTELHALAWIASLITVAIVAAITGMAIGREIEREDR
jgi:hypothetical protein